MCAFLDHICPLLCDLGDLHLHPNALDGYSKGFLRSALSSFLGIMHTAPRLPQVIYVSAGNFRFPRLPRGKHTRATSAEPSSAAAMVILSDLVFSNVFDRVEGPSHRDSSYTAIIY